MPLTNKSEEQPEWIEYSFEKLNGPIIGSCPVHGLRRRQLFAIDEADHLGDAGGDAAGKIAALEFRRDQPRR